MCSSSTLCLLKMWYVWQWGYITGVQIFDLLNVFSVAFSIPSDFHPTFTIHTVRGMQYASLHNICALWKSLNLYTSSGAGTCIVKLTHISAKVAACPFSDQQAGCRS